MQDFFIAFYAGSSIIEGQKEERKRVEGIGMKIVFGLILLVILIPVILKLLQRINIMPPFRKMTKGEVADTLEAFISGSSKDWDWDDFISLRLQDPELDKIQKECAVLPDKYPPKEKGQYCSPEGIEVLKNIVIKLRAVSR